MFAGKWKAGASWINDATSGLHEAQYLTLDSSRAREILGWQPRLNVETALEWTLRWYRECQEGADMARVTQAQIADFEQLAR